MSKEAAEITEQARAATTEATDDGVGATAAVAEDDAGGVTASAQVATPHRRSRRTRRIPDSPASTATPPGTASKIPNKISIRAHCPPGSPRAGLWSAWLA